MNIFWLALGFFALMAYTGKRMIETAHGSDVIGWPLITCVAGLVGFVGTAVYGIIAWML